MQHSRLLTTASDPFPQRLLCRLDGFAGLFTRPAWPNVLLLLACIVLAPGRRTVTAALRIMGRDRDPGFCPIHSLLNRAAWPAIAVAGQLPIPGKAVHRRPPRIASEDRRQFGILGLCHPILPAIALLRLPAHLAPEPPFGYAQNVAASKFWAAICPL